MRPRVFRVVWISTDSGREFPRWCVEFEDSCGCVEEEDFATAEIARRFAFHVASGGSRWEFVA